MLINNFLKIRDRVELHITSKERESIFMVRIQDITPEGIFIDRPIIDVRMLPPVVGKTIEIVFQKSDASYRFSTEVLEVTSLGRLPVYHLRHPAEMERIQLRKHFRLDLEIPMSFRLKMEKPEESHDATMIDISAGGVRFTIPTTEAVKYRIGSKLLLSFELTNSITITDMETLILKISEDTDFDYNSIVVCRFLDIPTKVREAIIVHNIRYQQRYRIEKK